MSFLGINLDQIDTTQFKLYGLFLLADGEWSAEKKKQLDAVRKNMQISYDRVEDVYSRCKNSKLGNGDHSEWVINEMKQTMRSSLVYGDYDKDYTNRYAKVVWNMICLSFADEKYSEAEQKVVQYLVKRWKIKSLVIDEFIDTAETIVLLEKLKMWRKAITQPSDKTDGRIKDIEKQIRCMYKNAMATIEEADAVPRARKTQKKALEDGKKASKGGSGKTMAKKKQ